MYSFCSRKRLTCTLCEGYYEPLVSYNKEKSDEPIIIVLDYAKIQPIFKDEIHISNSMYASRLTINGDLQEIQPFRNKLEAILFEIPAPITAYRTPRSRSLAYADFNDGDDIKCVADIKNIKSECYCVIIVTWDNIDSTSSWYYHSCQKCDKKLSLEGDQWFCLKCETNVNSINTKFKVNFTVVDKTGSTSLVLFDRDVVKLIGKNVVDVVNDMNEKELYNVLPSELDDLVGKKFIFRIQISDFHLKIKYPAYIVYKISDDESLINIFQTKTSSSKEPSIKNHGFSTQDASHTTMVKGKRPSSFPIRENQNLDTVELTTEKKRMTGVDEKIVVNIDDIESQASPTKHLLNVKVEKE